MHVTVGGEQCIHMGSCCPGQRPCAVSWAGTIFSSLQNQRHIRRSGAVPLLSSLSFYCDHCKSWSSKTKIFLAPLLGQPLSFPICHIRCLHQHGCSTSVASASTINPELAVKLVNKVRRQYGGWATITAQGKICRFNIY